MQHISKREEYHNDIAARQVEREETGFIIKRTTACKLNTLRLKSNSKRLLVHSLHKINIQALNDLRHYKVLQLQQHSLLYFSLIL